MYLQYESGGSNVVLGCNNFEVHYKHLKLLFLKSNCQIQNKFSILMWMQMFGSSVNADIHQVPFSFSFKKKDKHEQNANLEGYRSYSHFCSSELLAVLHV